MHSVGTKRIHQEGEFYQDLEFQGHNNVFMLVDSLWFSD